MAETNKKFSFKDVNWKELLSKTVKPVIGYSIIGGVSALVLIIGILCACL